MSDIDFRKKFVLFFFAVVVLVGGIFALTNQISDDVDNSGSNTSISEFNPQLVNSRTEDTNEITGFNPSSDTQVLQQEDTTETIDFFMYTSFLEDGTVVEYAIPIIGSGDHIEKTAFNGHSDILVHEYMYLDGIAIYSNAEINPYDAYSGKGMPADQGWDLSIEAIGGKINGFQSYNIVYGSGGGRVKSGVRRFGEHIVAIEYDFSMGRVFGGVNERYGYSQEEANQKKMDGDDIYIEQVDNYSIEIENNWSDILESAEVLSIGSRAEITELSWDEAIRMHDEYDRILNGLYQNLIRLYSEQDMEYQVDILRDQQRDWIRMRDEACADIQEASKTMCLADQTYRRMMTLSKGVFESSR